MVIKNYTNYLNCNAFKYGVFGVLLLSSISAASRTTGNKATTRNDLYGTGGVFEGLKSENEVVSLRTKYAKHFRNADGTFTAQTGDVYHYKDEQGKWQDIDLSIEPAATRFESKRNEIKSYFPNAAQNGGVVMQLNDQVSFSWWNAPAMSYTLNGRTIKQAAAPKAGSASGNTLIYPGVYAGISEEFVTLKTGVENNTIIHTLNPDLASLNGSDMVSFTQTIPMQGGWKVDVAGAVKNNDFTASDFHIAIPGTESGVFFNPVVVFDHAIAREEALYVSYVPQEKLTSQELADKQRSVYQAVYSVHFNGNNLEVTTRVPASWLQNSTRSFPVTIDPDVTITPPSSTGDLYGPTTNWYGFQRHANVYLASEIGVSNVNISSIEYNRTSTSGTSSTFPLKVFMRNYSAPTLVADAWNSTTYTGGLAPNYDGSMDLFGTTTGWKMITFSTPFNYTTDNLMVMVYDAYGGSGSAKYINQSTSSVASRQAYRRADGTDPGDGSTMTVESRLPEIRLTYVPSAPPVCVTAPIAPLNGNTICTGSTTLRWNKKDRASGYDVYLNTGTAAPTTIVSTNQADTSYTFTSTANDYTWKVIPKNATGPATGCTFFRFKAMTTITPDVTMSRMPNRDTLCPGDTVTLTANTVNAGLNPVYTWVKNGAVVGTNSNGYTSNALTANDTIYAVLRTSITGSCVTKTVDTSDKVNFRFRPAPSVSVSASGSGSFCLGQSVTLTANSGVGPGAAPATQYQWLNGNTSVNGATSNRLVVLYSGVYRVQAIAANGCYVFSDTVKVSANPAPLPHINRNGNTLSVEAYFRSYQWYRNAILIQGATTNSYTFANDGSYTVNVTDSNGCSGTSARIPINNLAIGNTQTGAEISIYPNPAGGVVNISAAAPVNVMIRSVEGKVVMQQGNTNSIDISPLANGIYMIQLTDRNGNLLKTEKLVKNNN